MSAVVCGTKRSFFEELPPSPPISKRLRCSTSTSPIRFSAFSLVDQLQGLFPHMDHQVSSLFLFRFRLNLVLVRGIVVLRLLLTLWIVFVRLVCAHLEYDDVSWQDFSLNPYGIFVQQLQTLGESCYSFPSVYKLLFTLLGCEVSTYMT